MSLDQFSDTGPNTIQDFAPDPDSVPVNNEASNINLAAHTALLSENPDDALGNFQEVKSDLDEGEGSSKGDDILSKATERADKITQQIVVDALIDPALSDPDKQAIVDKYVAGTAEELSIRNIVATEAIVAPSEGETREGEFQRILLTDTVNELNQVKAEQQAMLNGEAAKASTNTLGILADISELLIPFDEAVRTGDILRRLKKADPSAFDDISLIMGSRKEDIKNVLLNAPLHDRLRLTQLVIDAVNENAAIAMGDNNDYARVHFLRTFLEDGYFEDVDVWVDNVINVLDFTALGGVMKRGFQVSDAVVNQKRAMTRSNVQPVSPSQTIKDVNPAKAQAMHEAARADSSEAVAQSLYGTSREEAIANDLLGEVASVDDSVKAKTPQAGKLLDQSDMPDGELMHYAWHDGGIYYAQEDKRLAHAQVSHDFHNAKGLQARPELSQIQQVSDGTRVSMYYGPSQGGFSNPKAAIAMAKRALSDYAVGDESITLMRKVDDRYVPTTEKEILGLTTLQEKGAKGVKYEPNYLVRVDHRYSINPYDLDEMAQFDVKRNLFDYMGAGFSQSFGSIQRHMLDAASMLDFRITGGAGKAVDKAAGVEKRLLELGSDFTDVYAKLPTKRQQFLEKKIKWANQQEVDFNYNNLVAEGATANEIKALTAWQDYWKNMYWLENSDFVRTLNASGYKMFTDATTNTRMAAKPISKHNRYKVGMAYDAATDSVVPVTKADADALYEAGGSLAQVRNPFPLRDDLVEFIIAPDAQTLRTIGRNDQVLNYRRGYYPIVYKDPHFIVKVVRNGKGEEFQQAVATAGTTNDAKVLRDRLMETDGGEYFIRGDLKKSDRASSDVWDVEVARGRSAQKRRGKTLQDASSPITDPKLENIMDPVDSMIVAARSTANRVSMRPYMEATKRRFVLQYGHLFRENKFGEKVFPRSIEDLKPEIRMNEGDVADARTTLEYIKYLENGYRNSIDDGWKSLLNSMAAAAGRAGLSRSEKTALFMAEQRGPTGFGKNAAFQLYLALNPLRQFIVQSHQAVLLSANFPVYTTTRMVPDTAVISAIAMGQEPSKAFLKLSGRTRDEAFAMWKQFEDSGLAANIDRQNLLNGSLDQIANMSTLSRNSKKVKSALMKPVDISRTIGFDAGETVNMLTAWLAHRNKAVSAGQELTDEALDMIAAKARNYTGNMNFAGDMPYNQNSLALFMQFQQVPHKMLLTSLPGMNRGLTVGESSRLFGFNALMFTLPPAFMYELFGGSEWFESLEPETRDAFVQGLEGAVFNELLTQATGNKTRIDFSNLAPADAFGSLEFITEIATGEVGDILSNTPSGQLFFGNNPRITNAAKIAAGYFHYMVDDDADPVEFGEMSKALLSLSSGMSNGFKAALALDTAQRINSMGGVTDPEVSTTEAFLKAGGFSTLDEAQAYYVKNKAWKLSNAYKEDVNEWYKEMKKSLTRKGITPQELGYEAKMWSHAFRAFGNHEPIAKEIITKNLRRDVSDGDLKMYQMVQKSMALPSLDESAKLIMAMPNVTEEQREAMLKIVEDVKAQRGVE